MRLEKNFVETSDRNIRTFTLSFLNQADEEAFRYLPGQFAEVFVPGKGESPFGMASSPTEPGRLKFSVNRAGVVTTALHELTEGASLGVRGPLGHPYPVEPFKGKNVVIIGGGFAFSTLRALTVYLLDRRADYGNITVVYGARSPGLLLYKEELAGWAQRDDLNLVTTVDRGEEGWTGRVGFVPAVTKEVAPPPDNTYAVICGPPVMIKFTLPVLREAGYPDERIIMNLEMRMKCGLGMCGRCNIGEKYVCKDGPVFTLAELGRLPNEF
ncbi:MAG: FAD/NAD(P)-binding protein [Peptococcaceae bacterium]|jgi:NAD(P)H-flavin reductase|nr:FAD/NAD(P)-binding protein [Peptococcaceae bacterium]